ncbi:Enoyl- hydratase domain-containing 3, mitochondrial [Lecanosticta acicola]|uniref:Enoyl-CoA hydratase domain-containing protein 3, mitochondrial n=1 Tax=Lecanosticta acicola TaxID=111012 RepID=A0AAI9EE85_9PEZI|nr:Enoyl- hydratase domain-containing 3, mitochondrial [Lecanosticta acicola]
MSWPKLPARAAYLALKNPQHRNALSLSVLKDLKQQLVQYNTSPVDGALRILPPFRPNVLDDLEAVADGRAEGTELDADLRWLLDAETWRRERAGLPSVIVLRSEGPVFSSGHDLAELQKMSRDEVKETFMHCADLMCLIRRSPAPVVGVIQGLATAAGAQLALSTDLPIAAADTPFQLPGASIGLPCTSPSTAVSRRLGPAFAYRMMALAEPMPADQLPGGAVGVVSGPGELERRVKQITAKLSDEYATQPQALGKWAFWTQMGMNGSKNGGDGYEDAVPLAARIMALHAKSADAREEGIGAIFEKQRPLWKT